MVPTIQLPTDNLYKFICLLGLSLILSGCLAFFTVYSSTLDKTEHLIYEIIDLEAKESPPQQVIKTLKIKNKLLEVYNKNKQTYLTAVGVLIALGIICVVEGGRLWHSKIQLRDDELSELQLRKLRLEVEAAEEKAKENKPHLINIDGVA